MDGRWQQSAEQAPGKEQKYINKKRNLLYIYIHIYIYICMYIGIYISLIEAIVVILLMKVLLCK